MSATHVSAVVPDPVYNLQLERRQPHAGESIAMQYRDVLLQQRVRCIAEQFQERTAHEAEPLSRDRILEVIRAIVADLEGELRREALR